MHNAFVTRTNGTSVTQIFLFLLIQFTISHGKITYQQGYRHFYNMAHPLPPLQPEQIPHIPHMLFPLHPAQKDQKKADPTVPGAPESDDVAPHVENLGFFPRGNVLQNPDDIKHMLPEIMNRSRVHDAQNKRIWQDIVSKKLDAMDARRQGDNATSLQDNSSQSAIPHLFRLRFGVSNNSPFFGNRDIGERSNKHSGLDRQGALGNLHHTVVLGIGSFLGGVLVILLLLVIIFLRRRRIQQHQLRHDVESKPDDPKLTLLNHEARPPMAHLIDELTNEMSSSSYASTYSTTSSGSGETSSQTSNTSHNSDLWHCPDQIAMTALYQGAASYSNNVHDQTDQERNHSCTSDDTEGACGISPTISPVHIPDIVDVNASLVPTSFINLHSEGDNSHIDLIAMTALHHANKARHQTSHVIASSSFSLLDGAVDVNATSPVSSFSFPDKIFNREFVHIEDKRAPVTSRRSISSVSSGSGHVTTVSSLDGQSYVSNSPMSHRKSSFPVQDGSPDSPIMFSAGSCSPFSYCNPSFEYGTSNPPSPVVIRRRSSETSSHSNSLPQRPFINTMPDLLSRCRPKSIMHKRSSSSFNRSSRKVSEDGGILSCCGGDIVAIVPPGAVHGDHTFHVRTITEQSGTTSIKSNSSELVVSPVVEITSANINVFHKPITLKMPFRGLTSNEESYCRCQDDPLCSCKQSSLVLRYWDKSTSSWRPTEYKTGNYGMVSHYTWPECFSPEPDIQDLSTNSPKPHVTYNFFKNMCTLQTNTLGTFCVTSHSGEPGLVSSHGLLNSQIPHQRTIAKMCMTVGAKYHLSPFSESTGRSQLRRNSSGTSYKRRSFDEAGPASYIRQITYTAYICDNTVVGRKQIQEIIQTSGGHQQCACIPLDVPVGSEVKVTLTSTRKPDWPWTIPCDSSSCKVVQWKNLCSDYGTLARVDFHCLPKNADVAITSEDTLLTGFQVETEVYNLDHWDSLSVKLTASSRYASQ